MNDSIVLISTETNENVNKGQRDIGHLITSD